MKLSLHSCLCLWQPQLVKYCGGDFGCDFRCSFLVYFNYIPSFLNYSAISSLQKDLATIYCDDDREYKHYHSKELVIWSSWINLLACPVCCTLHRLKLQNLLILLSSLLISNSAACLLLLSSDSMCMLYWLTYPFSTSSTLPTDLYLSLPGSNCWILRLKLLTSEFLGARMAHSQSPLWPMKWWCMFGKTHVF